LPADQTQQKNKLQHVGAMWWGLTLRPAGCLLVILTEGMFIYELKLTADKESK